MSWHLTVSWKLYRLMNAEIWLKALKKLVDLEFRLFQNQTVIKNFKKVQLNWKSLSLTYYILDDHWCTHHPLPVPAFLSCCISLYLYPSVFHSAPAVWYLTARWSQSPHPLAPPPRPPPHPPPPMMSPLLDQISISPPAQPTWVTFIWMLTCWICPSL